jgi:hypothetical protein
MTPTDEGKLETLYRSESRRILATPHPPHSEILTWLTTRSTVRFRVSVWWCGEANKGPKLDLLCQ